MGMQEHEVWPRGSGVHHKVPEMLHPCRSLRHPGSFLIPSGRTMETSPWTGAKWCLRMRLFNGSRVLLAQLPEGCFSRMKPRLPPVTGCPKSGLEKLGTTSHQFSHGLGRRCPE